ncbi:MAG: hypothetical protein U0572_00590 [Phycisphaerales bacterium]
MDQLSSARWCSLVRSASLVVFASLALVSCTSRESGVPQNPLAAGVPVKVTADDALSGDDVVVQVEMQGWSSPGGDVTVEWGDTSSLVSPITKTKAYAAKFSFKQPTKSGLTANVANKVTVRTSSAESDAFTVKKR